MANNRLENDNRLEKEKMYEELRFKAHFHSKSPCYKWPEEKEKEYKIRTLTVIFEYFDDDDEDEVNNEMDICVLSPRNCWLPVGTDHSAHHFFTLMTMMTILIILIMMMVVMMMNWDDDDDCDDDDEMGIHILSQRNCWSCNAESAWPLMNLSSFSAWRGH